MYLGYQTVKIKINFEIDSTYTQSLHFMQLKIDIKSNISVIYFNFYKSDQYLSIKLN